jgi:hypothetical protein
MTRLRRSSTNLRHALECDSFTYAPRLDPQKAILAMLEPPVPHAEPAPPLKPGIVPSWVMGGADSNIHGSCG